MCVSMRERERKCMRECVNERERKRYKNEFGRNGE